MTTAAYQRAWRDARREIRKTGQRLTPSLLQHFARPLSWPEILALEPHRPRTWWRQAIIAADEYGMGWLCWDRRSRTWSLTERGRSISRIRIV